jgi:serine/threonine protein kinase
LIAQSKLLILTVMSRRKKLPTFKSAYDEYVALEIRGEGGSGRVYRALTGGGTDVAIKVLHPHNVTSERRRRFKNETLFCIKNSHANILTVSDYGVVDIDGIDCPFYVMPFYGQTLRTIMNEGVNQQSALKYFAQILNGVEAAHLRNVWHRDLKPENILFDDSNNRLIVADFGVARFVKDDLLTAVETKPGTRLANFQYAAPEQRARNSTVDHRADIFALGLILNEFFTREVIFGTSYRTIGSVAPNLSYLDGLVEKMICQAPNDRLQSIDAIQLGLIARKNEFVQQQKLNALKNQVVPTSEIDDPLVIHPVRIVDVDFHNGNLIIKLSHQLTNEWIQVFRRIVGVTFETGRSPRNIPLRGDTAEIRLHSEREAQGVVDRFKTYLDKANKDYAEFAEKKKRSEEAAARSRIQEEIAHEERRSRVLGNIKF